jgi:hypothetical protein
MKPVTRIIRERSVDRSGALVHWAESGQVATIIGQPQVIFGQSWTPVLFMNEIEPDWVKTEALGEACEAPAGR